jgi:hypothetical protein
LKITAVFPIHLPPGAIGGSVRASADVRRSRSYPCCSMENVAMRPYDFSPLSRSTVGFHFSLADHVEVERTTFENGLLQRDLVRKVPKP